MNYNPAFCSKHPLGNGIVAIPFPYPLELLWDRFTFLLSITLVFCYYVSIIAFMRMVALKQIYRFLLVGELNLLKKRTDGS